MGTISVSLPSDGETADVADYNTPITTVVNEINGGLDNANIASDAAIDGSKLADGSVTTAKLADGSVTPAKLTSGTGSSWAWQDWTPTLTNLSGGTLNTSKYVQIGKTVFIVFRYTLAGAGVSGSVSFTLPVTASANFNSALMPIGQCTYEDTGTATYKGYIAMLTTTTARLYAENVGGTYALADTQLSSTVPHTWANTDVIRVFACYEAA